MTSDPSRRLDRAVARTVDQALRNGLPEEDIDASERSIAWRTLRIVTRCDVQVERSTATRRAAGGPLLTPDQARAEAEAHARFLTSDEQLLSGWLDELARQPFQSLGQEALDTDPALTRAFTSRAACRPCGGGGQRTCGRCGGRGSSPCSCTGGQRLCGLCSATGRVPDHGTPGASNICPHCGGLGATTCSTCGGRQALPCHGCGASGRVACRSCGGDGHIDEVLSVGPRVALSSTLDWGGIAPADQQVLERGRLAELLTRHAQPEPPTIDRAAPGRGRVATTARLLQGRFVLRIGERRYAFTTVGSEPQVIPHDGFLTDLVRDGLEALRAVGRGRLGRAGSGLERAAGFEVLHKALDSATDGHDQDSCRGQLQRAYPGLDHDQADTIASAARGAVQRIRAGYQRRAGCLGILWSGTLLGLGLGALAPRPFGFGDAFLLIVLAVLCTRIRDAGATTSAELLDEVLGRDGDPGRARRASVWRLALSPGRWLGRLPGLLLLTWFVLTCAEGLGLYGRTLFPWLHVSWLRIAWLDGGLDALTRPLWSAARQAGGPLLRALERLIGALNDGVVLAEAWVDEQLLRPVLEALRTLFESGAGG